MSAHLQIQDDIACITLDDGKVNALSELHLTELRTQLEEAAGSARVTILSGRTGIFSAGFDMPTFSRDRAAINGMVGAGMQTVLQMLAHPHPIVAACTGHAYPMGAFLLLSSDVRLGCRGGYRIGMNEVAIGITVPHFALALARDRLTPAGLVGVLTGRMFSPEGGVQVGYLDEVHDAAALPIAARAHAEALLPIDLEAYRATKQRINAPLSKAIREAASEFS